MPDSTSSASWPLPSADDVQRTNWNGSIPIQLSLAPTSLSSPTMPPPSHRLISRQSYLHVALEDDVRKFHEFAPVSVNYNFNFRTASQTDANDKSECDGDGNGNGNGNDECHGNDKSDKNVNGLEGNEDGRGGTATEEDKSYPVCWFEDEVTGIALRWQVFIGVLFDLLQMKQLQLRRQQKKPQENSMGISTLPWKIRIHFTSYPATLLPLAQDGNRSGHGQDNHNNDAKQFIFQYYLNSLKQSLYIQHNSNKVSKNMSKQSHLQLWDGITRNQWEVYRGVASELNGNINAASSANNSTGTGTSTSNGSGQSFCSSVPIRILMDGRPVFSRPCPPYRYTRKQGDNHEQNGNDDNGGGSGSGSGNDSSGVEMTTLRHVLEEWLPDLCFGSSNNNVDEDDDNGGDGGGNSNDREAMYLVQGMKIPLECHVVDMWRALCHPDRFLYVTVVTKRDGR